MDVQEKQKVEDEMALDKLQVEHETMGKKYS